MVSFLQLLALAGHQAESVSCSKYQTAVATSTGDVYSWEGKNCKADTIPVPLRVHGMKHATKVSVGENHSVVVAALSVPEYPLSAAGPRPSAATQSFCSFDDEVERSSEMDDDEVLVDVFSPKNADAGSRPLPSLKDLCQRQVAQSIVEPKNALQILEFADSLGADILRGHCEVISRSSRL